MSAPRVRLSGVRKAFSGVPVLRGVDLDVLPGEVLGLVGENGAGKSTLMNLLGGQLAPDEGTIALDGRAYAPRTPADAARAGIGFVHQELSLFPNLTIAENLRLRSLPRRRPWPWIDCGALSRFASDLLSRVGLQRPPSTLVGELSAGERQLVEIARALGDEVRVLMLDEPTTSLGASERTRLLRLVTDLRAGGLSILFVSHDLDDVLRTCDRVAVLRDGTLVDLRPATAFDHDTLVRLMVGRNVHQLYPDRARRSALPATPLLSVRGLGRRGVVRDVTLDVYAGEIVGLFGLLGAGRSELARILFGIDREDTGVVRLDDEPLEGPPAARIARGLALVTEDRRLDGLCLEASVAHNLSLADLRRYAGVFGVLDARRERAATTEMATSVHLTGATDLDGAVGRLSGGNQQKVVLGKWLLTRPRVLLLDEPTRGIDVGARAELYRLLADLAASGTALLMISSELEELLGLCDRVLVMRAGAITGHVARDRYDREAILRAALPATVTA